MVQRVAWVVVALVAAVDLGVLAVWPSTHRAEDKPAAAAFMPSATSPTTPAAASSPAPASGDAAAASPATTARPQRSSPKGTAAASAPPSQGTKAASINRGEFLFDLGVTPPCSKRLTDMVATIRAVPGAYVSMIVAYSDGESYGTMYAGPVQDDGTFVFRWKVPATAATGTGHVLASGHDPATNTSGRNAVEFIVSEAKGC
jgi:hypothetical protein